LGWANEKGSTLKVKGQTQIQNWITLNLPSYLNPTILPIYDLPMTYQPTFRPTYALHT
jgi:hypothetical protein